MGLAGGSHPTTGTTFPGGKAGKKGTVHGPAAPGVTLHLCQSPALSPGSPTVCVPPQHKMRLLYSSPGLGAPAPHQPHGLQGLILCSRDRVGSAVTLTTLQGFPQ